jgi:hypothetical protein
MILDSRSYRPGGRTGNYSSAVLTCVSTTHERIPDSRSYRPGGRTGNYSSAVLTCVSTTHERIPDYRSYRPGGRTGNYSSAVLSCVSTTHERIPDYRSYRPGEDRELSLIFPIITKYFLFAFKGESVLRPHDGVVCYDNHHMPLLSK